MVYSLFLATVISLSLSLVSTSTSTQSSSANGPTAGCPIHGGPIAMGGLHIKRSAQLYNKDA